MNSFLTQWRAKYRGELLFMMANFATPFVGFLASLVAMRYVSPRNMGNVQAVLLFVPYLGLLHLGVFTGLNRNVAYYLARSERSKAMRMIGASLAMSKWNAMAGILFGMGLFAYHSARPDPNGVLLASIPVVTAMLVFGPMANHLAATYRSGQHFEKLGRVTWVDNGARSVYMLLPAFVGWVGYVGSLFLHSVIRYVLLRRYEPYPNPPAYLRSDMYELIKVGFPILVYTYVSSLLLVADQTLVAMHMTKEELGYFSLSRLLIHAVQIIPATLSIIISPKVAACFGRTESPRALRRHLWGILGIHLLMLVPVCLLAYAFAGPVIHRFMPAYAPGVPVAQITALTCLVNYSFGALLATTATMRKNTIPIVLFASALICMWVAGLLLFRITTPSIESIAWLRFYVTVALAGGLFLYTYRETARD